jgi:methionyl-tRNA formyltransferase
MLGKKSFSLSIFCIDRGIDSGPILDSRTFALTPTDDIRTSYIKVALLTGEMLVEALSSGRIFDAPATEQSGQPYYLPQRRAEDGEIDWRQPVETVYNTIRALAHPYPGAYTFWKAQRVIIWRARPIDLNVVGSVPGRIIECFSDGTFLVGTASGLLFVEEYKVEGDDRPAEGASFSSVDLNRQINRIVARHQERYPQLPVSPDLIALTNCDTGNRPKKKS